MDVLMIGGSGLVGNLCLHRLVDQSKIGSIYTLSRKPLPHSDPKVSQRVGPAEQFVDLMSGIQVEAAVCCLGTTIRNAGSREAFEEVDLNLPLHFAKAAQQSGAKTFHVISALGADASSKNFYLRIKGVLENELKRLGFVGLHIYRPSLLLGERQEFRLAEVLASRVYKRLEFLYPRALDAYRPMDAQHLASFMVRQVLEARPGIHVWENAVMQKASGL